MLCFNACDALIPKQSVTNVQILASSEKHKINPMFCFGFCCSVFGGGGSVVVFFQAGLELKSEVIELRELILAIH